MGSRKPTPAEQMEYLVDTYPPNSKVKCKVTDIIGIVKGYRLGEHIKRPNEMALIVDIPGDTRVLYSDEVLTLNVKN